jgi:hypothetical protein
LAVLIDGIEAWFNDDDFLKEENHPEGVQERIVMRKRK